MHVLLHDLTCPLIPKSAAPFPGYLFPPCTLEDFALITITDRHLCTAAYSP